jgi:hypothetical protein
MLIRDNEPDYKVWSKWAEAHGMNHCRLRVIQPKTGDKYKPYASVGKDQYDLTRFDPTFWQRFRKICRNLSDHGIVIHLLLFPHNAHVRNGNWGESLFNPVHNINSATEHLNDSNHYRFWHSYSDGQTGLWQIQKKTVEKIIELTADLDNIYFDLSHEFRTDCCGAQKTDWAKSKQFFVKVAQTIREKYAELQPEKMPLIGLDAEHFAKSGQRDWNFGNSAFDLMILGNSSHSPVPSVDQVISWRETFKKTFLLQEGGADDDKGGKIGISYNNTDPTIIRKYIWKWMMAKNQFIDIYQKQLAENYPDNYNPAGHSTFEDDALILRDFWNQIIDYGTLDFEGEIRTGPGFRRMALSSRKEALVYMASAMRDIGTTYSAQQAIVSGLTLQDGHFAADVWKPSAPDGLVESQTVEVRAGSLKLSLPDFTDDLAVHIYRTGQTGSTGPAIAKATVPTAASPRKPSLVSIKPHRGGAGEFPENTLYAFHQNLNDGTSLDMDIRRTADGDIVLMHDLTTGRTCDEDWVVTTKTVDELKTLNAAWRFDPKRDGSFPLRNEAIRIPTLEEVLALFAERKSPGAIAWIDTKDDKESTITQNRGLYDRLIELIDQFGLWQEIIIEVGSVDQAEALRKRDSRVRTAYWASNLPAVQEAILYPGYIQIGISLSLADEAAQLVKASGKELQVNDRQFIRLLGPG